MTPYLTYGLVCQGCEQEARVLIGPDQMKADAVIWFRRLGWMRLFRNNGFRTYCPECVAVMRPISAPNPDAGFWLEDGGTH